MQPLPSVSSQSSVQMRPGSWKEEYSNSSSTGKFILCPLINHTARKACTPRLDSNFLDTQAELDSRGPHPSFAAKGRQSQLTKTTQKVAELDQETTLTMPVLLLAHQGIDLCLE